ncbi:hypothetical protein CEP52_017278 [Fusarium oligoseptatum]|uniref:SnoaL-like domain-containing protein n=1 Tax=Fusarium oligoseptatum TaxID=2604345 RepID=A0A428RU29_9HYPO|nr:hypothetical protein CEP52_017278 [Fusarium oligoseptatum]
MVRVYGAGTIPVNGPEAPFVLTRDQLWQALQRKIRYPSEFVPVLSGCKVHRDENGIVDREIRFQQAEGSVSTNLISFHPSVSDTNLMLTYIFEWDWPTIKEGTAEHKELVTEMSENSRDSCEWDNLLSIFHPDAYIYTTWTGRSHHQDFIAASKAGMDKGAFIMHRCHGSSTDVNLDATRAITKMKATITQRFNIDGCEVDAESDCRFCFFWEKTSGEWKARYVR